MKFLSLLSLLICSGALAQTSQDITVSGYGVSITVRGSGNFVCSAQDGMMKRPRLGRGVTRAEALANARYLAAMTTSDHSDFFVDAISCEGSNSGSGSISISRDAGGMRVSVEGPSAVQCISKNSMANAAFPYIATAGTKTEAFALSSNACTMGSHDDGFFCETRCETIAAAPTGAGGFDVRRIDIQGIRIPGLRFPRNHR